MFTYSAGYAMPTGAVVSRAPAAVLLTNLRLLKSVTLIKCARVRIAHGRFTARDTSKVPIGWYSLIPMSLYIILSIFSANIILHIVNTQSHTIVA